ncbi:unnamed protein product [Withania somnifera]
MPKIFASHHNWHFSIIHTIKIEDPTTQNGHHPVPKILYSYDNVFHGFSAVLSKDDFEALKKSPGFLSAYKVRPLEAHTTHTPEFLKLNPASGLWPSSGFGQDVIIGVLDSGVWPESASSSDAGLSAIPKKWKGVCKPGIDFNSSLCNRKLIEANYFNKGLLASGTDGHGTHVASVVAGSFAKGASYFGYASGTARGMAPRARIAVYKFSFEEGIFTSDLSAAMDQAVADGANILTISYGWFHIPLYQYSIAIASFRAMMKGVLASASAGNSGLEMGTLSNGVPRIFTVASCNTNRSFSGTLLLRNGLNITGFSLFPVKSIIKDLPVIYNEKSISSCGSSNPLSEIPNVERSIMICYSTTIEVEEQMAIISISKSGFGGAIYIYDDPYVLTSNFFPNPGAVISTKEGKQVIDYATKSVRPKGSISFQATHIDVKPAQVVLTFSSKGPSRSYQRVAKKDIMAPGELILAAWPSNVSAATIGTSMAAPDIAGIAAMVKGAYPDWSPSAVPSAMIITANRMDNTKNHIKTADDNRDAIDPGLIYDAAPQHYVNLLCSMNFTQKQFKTIARSSAKHNCSNPSDDINYPSFIALLSPNGNYTWLKQKFRRTVTNVGAGAAKYVAKEIAPKNSTISVSPQTLVFEKKNQKQDYTLTIRYKGIADGRAQSGSITWVEEMVITQ